MQQKTIPVACLSASLPSPADARQDGKVKRFGKRVMLLSARFLILCSPALPLTVSAQPRIYADGLTYRHSVQSPVPIPPSEQALQTTVAGHWCNVTGENHSLEGIICDDEGNLLFCDVTARQIIRITQDKHRSVIHTFESLSPGGLALHHDGRLFVAAINLEEKNGGIFALDMYSHEIDTIVSPKLGYLPNDLVFDANGGFYFSDFRGSSTQPDGGVYYVSPDYSSISCVIPRLAMANGIALSPDGKCLWVTEFARNLLHYCVLETATTALPTGTGIAYHFTGTAPDSMRSDADGNLYVAIYGQARVLVFNRNGIPIGQILLPQRESGHHLLSTSLAIHPETRDLYIVSGDGGNGLGANIFYSKAFSRGITVLPE